MTHREAGASIVYSTHNRAIINANNLRDRLSLWAQMSHVWILYGHVG